MSTSSAPPDEGLFRERTALAWQRTGLSILGASLVMLRLSSRGSWVTVTLIVAGGLLAAFAALESRRRSRRAAPAGEGVARVALLMSTALALLLTAELELTLTGLR
jgi:uncharacterized membrane protein YidH (DUF202 family)